MINLANSKKAWTKAKKIIKQTIGVETSLKLKDLSDRLSTKERELTLNRKSFFEGFLAKGELCFDVGANVGNRITPFLQLGAKVVAVEPQEPCYRLLKWKFGNKITLVTKGLCEKECVRKFHISTNTSAISSFSDEWINSVKVDRFSQNDWDKTIEVEMTTLDNLIKEYGKPSFIKIDVEGYELEVLNGLSQPIKMISIEFTVPEQSNKIVECIDRIKSINPDIECNFTIGEETKFAKDKWLTVQELYELIKTQEFIWYRFGDIYIRNTKL